MRYEVPTENDEQKDLFRWAAYSEGVHPELKLMHAIPNGATTSKRQGACLVGEGVRKGVPDICLPVARGAYHGMYIELKRTQGGTVRPEQKAWIAALNEQGFRAVVCKGWVEAVSEIERYLSLAPGAQVGG